MRNSFAQRENALRIVVMREVVVDLSLDFLSDVTGALLLGTAWATLCVTAIETAYSGPSVQA